MGVLPATQTPPDAMTPEKVITDVSHSAGAVRETGTFPPFKASVFFSSQDDQRNFTGEHFYHQQVRDEN